MLSKNTTLHPQNAMEKGQNSCIFSQNENKTENSSVYKRELRIGIFFCIEEENSTWDT